MKESDSIEKAILDAMKKARQQGQPVNELLHAIASGEEIESWIEPAEPGKVTLTIAFKESCL